MNDHLLVVPNKKQDDTFMEILLYFWEEHLKSKYVSIKKAMISMLDFKDNNELILRDYLALERTKLANVRTLFSYIRTALYLLTAGIGILQIESISYLDSLAWICIVSGIVLFFLGLISYWQIRKHLKGYINDTQNHDIHPSI